MDDSSILGTDIIGYILSHICQPINIYNASLVCKRWFITIRKEISRIDGYITVDAINHYTKLTSCRVPITGLSDILMLLDKNIGSDNLSLILKVRELSLFPLNDKVDNFKYYNRDRELDLCGNYLTSMPLGSCGKIRDHIKRQDIHQVYKPCSLEREETCYGKNYGPFNLCQRLNNSEVLSSQSSIWSRWRSNNNKIKKTGSIILDHEKKSIVFSNKLTPFYYKWIIKRLYHVWNHQVIMIKCHNLAVELNHSNVCSFIKPLNHKSNTKHIIKHWKIPIHLKVVIDSINSWVIGDTLYRLENLSISSSLRGLEIFIAPFISEVVDIENIILYMSTINANYPISITLRSKPFLFSHESRQKSKMSVDMKVIGSYSDDTSQTSIIVGIPRQ